MSVCAASRATLMCVAQKKMIRKQKKQSMVGVCCQRRDAHVCMQKEGGEWEWPEH